MIGFALRGFFLIGIISVYSAGMFKLINDYFRSEYKTYLSTEFKRNKYLMPNVELPDHIQKDIQQQDETKSKVIFYLPKYIKDLSSPAPQCIATKTKNTQNNEDDEDIVNYWLDQNRNKDDKIEAHCQVDENLKCKDN
ncbi:hypothetical protein ACKWTF_010300 [Chironomus riparius]